MTAVAKAPRQTLERVQDPDGVVHVQGRQPEACVLHYTEGWVTILVRRTHDVELAAELAQARLEQIADLVTDYRYGPDGIRSTDRPPRVGWWATVPASRPAGPGEATDYLGRIVAASNHLTAGAGAGVEFLVGRAT